METPCPNFLQVVFPADGWTLRGRGSCLREYGLSLTGTLRVFVWWCFFSPPGFPHQTLKLIQFLLIPKDLLWQVGSGKAEQDSAPSLSYQPRSQEIDLKQKQRRWVSGARQWRTGVVQDILLWNLISTAKILSIQYHHLQQLFEDFPLGEIKYFWTDLILFYNFSSRFSASILKGRLCSAPFGFLPWPYRWKKIIMLPPPYITVGRFVRGLVQEMVPYISKC